MARKSKGQEESGGNWMDTYGDMVTLLMTFFIALYSMSSVQEDKWAQLVEAFSIDGPEKVDQIVFTAVGEGDKLVTNKGEVDGQSIGDDPNQEETDFSELYNMLKEYIQQNEMADVIQIESASSSDGDSDGEGSGDGQSQVQGKEGYQNIYIQFSNSILFQPDDDTLINSSNEIMSFMGNTLKQYEGHISKIVIKGYTADSEYSKVDERELSTMRATVVSNYFEKLCGVKSTMLVASGYGHDYPIADNNTEEGRAKNRRVEIVIIPVESELSNSSYWDTVFGSYYSEKSLGDIVDVIGD